MKIYIAIAQTVVAVIIIAFILLQERSSGLSGFLGGGDSGGFYQARRGMERVVFIGTIALSVLFVVLAIVQLVVH